MNMPVSMTYRCGCVNELDQVTMIYRSASKCSYHKKWAEEHREGQEYYERIGTVDYGKKIDTQHVQELRDALPGLFRDLPQTGRALEVGCGASPYASWIVNNIKNYYGIDQSKWAADWTAKNHDVPTAMCSIEDFPLHALGDFPLHALGFDFILAAHVLEHLKDAPRMLRKMVDLLYPSGRLVIVVPDDEDPTNPDHLWFFTEPALRRLMTDSGLSEVNVVTKRIVPHERFMYAEGTKS